MRPILPQTCLDGKSGDKARRGGGAVEYGSDTQHSTFPMPRNSARFPRRARRRCTMPRHSKSQAAPRHQFLLHKTSGRVGLLTGVRLVNGKTQKTIRLAGGELLTAPTSAFRLATESEIERRHSLAASIKPFAIPSLPMPRSLNPPKHAQG